MPTWSASGRRGAVADDARAREVEPCHSSEEAGEQSRAEAVAAAESVERRAGAEGNADQRPRTGLSAGHAWYWCWRAYIKLQSLIVRTRGGNRMRESCESGFVQGARGNSRPYRVRCLSDAPWRATPRFNYEGAWHASEAPPFNRDIFADDRPSPIA